MGDYIQGVNFKNSNYKTNLNTQNNENNTEETNQNTSAETIQEQHQVSAKDTLNFLNQMGSLAKLNFVSPQNGVSSEKVSELLSPFMDKLADAVVNNLNIDINSIDKSMKSFEDLVNTKGMNVLSDEFGSMFSQLSEENQLAIAAQFVLNSSDL